MMKIRFLIGGFVAFLSAFDFSRAWGEPATVTEVANVVVHGASDSSTHAEASVGTPIHDGEYLKTIGQSRAEMQLPTAPKSITRLGANTTFNYSVESNVVDLQAGTILFCKPKDAQQLSIKTAAVTAGISGTTGFVSVTGEGSKRITIFGIIEGHATATGTADGKRYQVGAGEIIEFRPGRRPFAFDYDVPRFVKSSPLIHRFKSTLPNQSYIDREIASYDDDVSRGFIQPPSGAIDYSGDIPIISDPSYDSAQNSQGQRGNAPPSSQSGGGRNIPSGNGGGYPSNFH